MTSKLFCGKTKGGQSSSLSLSLCKRHTLGVTGRKELSSDIRIMSGLWILVQVNCSSMKAAGMFYRYKGDEINWKKSTGSAHSSLSAAEKLSVLSTEYLTDSW